jgi:hypothetical protein
MPTINYSIISRTRIVNGFGGMWDRIYSNIPPNLIDIFFHYCEQGTNSHYINTNVAIWWTCWWAYWYIINNQQMKNLIKVSTPKKVCP